MELRTGTNGRRLSILVVDDDHETLELMRDMFDAVGQFEVLTESDARRALVLLAGHNPDLLVCDLSMPGMDGIEFLQEAAASRYQGSVLLLSGMDSGVRHAAERLAHVQGLRMLPALGKPVELEQLRRAVQLLETAP